MDQGQFDQFLDALQQGLVPLEHPPQPAVAFMLSPGQANTGQLIDYESTVGIKIWQEATTPLSFQFLCKAWEVNSFSEKLLKWA